MHDPSGGTERLMKPIKEYALHEIRELYEKYSADDFGDDVTDPTHLVVMKQEGGVCDYTIGCGYAVVPIRASTYEAAVVMAYRVFDWYGMPDLDYAYLVTAYDTVPVEDWAEEIMEEDAATEEVAARAEYERLKRRFG